MSENQQLQQRIDQLESQLAFQEDTISQLNREVAEHTESMMRMQAQVKYLADRLRSIQPSNIATQAEETPPPHY